MRMLVGMITPDAALARPSAPRGWRYALLACAALVAVATTAAGCKKKGKGTTPSDATSTSASKVDPTLCEVEGKNVVSYDLNRDGKPDVWRLYKAEKAGDTTADVLTCRQVDLDHDGRKDMVIAFARNGQPLYEKIDFDWDGKFDVSAIYDPKTGKYAEVERDTNFDGKYDLKELYDAAGALESVRRDRDGNGEPDMWEQYEGGLLVAILYDDDNDTKVDRREEAPGSRKKIDMPDIDTSTAESVVPGTP